VKKDEITMKSLSLIILMLAFASFATGQTVSIQGAGDQASTFLETSGGHINLTVTKGTGASGNPSTLLMFHNETGNPDGTVTSVIGLGQIPDNAFTSNGPSRMNLSVDTSQVAGFKNTTCIFTPSPNFGFTCSPSQGGPIQVSWTGNGINSDAGTEHRDTTIGPVTMHVDGHGSFSSADTQGSILGLSFSSTGEGFGSFISSGHTHTITITQN
jgi:hypothetical protein